MIHELFTFFNWLGSEWVLVTLIGLSILTVWVTLERWFEIDKLVKASRRFWNEHAESWFQNADGSSWRVQLDDLRLNYPCMECDALDLIHRSRSKKDVDQSKMVEAYLEQRKIKLERHIGILGTIGANAPFVGLLGTVLGIIRAFHDMSVLGLSGGVENISGGIAEALVATAIGLMVAVPAVICFNILNKKIGTLLRRAQSVSLLVLSNGKTKSVEGE